MEELVDELINDLVDKKEISKNDSVDMKITLMEAIPYGIDKDTIVRVISTLKSKMETPSANIFTDKGVNIEAVRTIANETVKNVIEKANKEIAEDMEKEKAQATKVADEIDSMINNKEENVLTDQKDNNKNDDYEYESSVFNNVSFDKVEEKFKELDEKYGDSFTDDVKEIVSEAEVSFDDLNERILKLVEEQKISIEEARKIIIQELSDGDEIIKEQLQETYHDIAYVRLKDKALSEFKDSKKSYREIAILILKKNPEEFAGIDNPEKLVEEIISDFLKNGILPETLGLDRETNDIPNETLDPEFEKILDESSDVFYNLCDDIVKEIRKGNQFFDAVKNVLKYYPDRYDYKLVVRELKNVYENICMYGLIENTVTEEELSEMADSLVQEEKGEISETEDKTETVLEQDVDEGQIVSDRTVISQGITKKTKEVIGFDYSTKKQAKDVALSRDEQMAKLEEVSDEITRTKFQDVVDKYERMSLKKSSKIYTLKGVYNNAINEHKTTIEFLKDRRNVENELINSGELSSTQRSIMRQRERYTKKAVEVYLSGAKSAYEIIKELGEAAEKFEIMPEDIINEVVSLTKLSAPQTSIILEKNENELIELHIMLDAAKKELQNKLEGKDSKARISAVKIREEILKLEKRIEDCRSQTIETKFKYGTIDIDKHQRLNSKMKIDIQDSFEYINQMEKVKSMQRVYREIQSDSEKNGTTFDIVARKKLKEDSTLSEVFGLEFEEVIKKGDNLDKNEILRKVQNCIRTQNNSYIKIIEKNISNVEQDVQQYGRTETTDKGYTDAMLEKSHLERELNKALDRKERLSIKAGSFKSKNDEEKKVLSAKRAALSYFSTDHSIAEICEAYKRKNINLEIDDVISEVRRVAIVAGVGEQDINTMIKTERELANDNTKLIGLNRLKINAENQSKYHQGSALEFGINKIKKNIDSKKEFGKSLKSQINAKVEDISTVLGVEETVAKQKQLLKKRPVRLARNSNGQMNITRSENQNPKQFDTRKRCIAVSNIAKLVEANGTTSQDIVGEVTDLNKMARAQEERVVDSTEQRDS